MLLPYLFEKQGLMCRLLATTVIPGFKLSNGNPRPHPTPAAPAPGPNVESTKADLLWQLACDRDCRTPLMSVPPRAFFFCRLRRPAQQPPASPSAALFLNGVQLF